MKSIVRDMKTDTIEATDLRIKRSLTLEIFQAAS